MGNNGYFDELNRPRLTINVIGGRARAKLDALIDTGFDGSLCLPLSIAVQLGLELTGVTYVEFADGTMRRELTFMGRVGFGKFEGKVEILLTESEDTLIGLELLKGSRLEIDFKQRKLKIT